MKMIACTFSLHKRTLSFWHPILHRQSTTWLVEPFIYQTLKSYRKVQIRSCHSHGFTSVKLLARIVSSGFGSVSRVK